VAAAPHLFDHLLVASPELALVDVDLAAQLREEIRSGGDFRPRWVARPEFGLLQSVEVTAEPAPEEIAEDEVTIDVDPVVVAVDAQRDAPVSEPSELPDYIVVPEEGADDVGAAAAFLEVALDPPAVDESSDLPDYIVLADGVVDEDLASDVAAAAGEASGSNDYPILPDLGVATETLDESDVALRKIREHFSSEEPSGGHRRLRRGFIAASGLGAVAALALFAVDMQQGVAALPGWLGF
jgi:hypothetical protein